MEDISFELDLHVTGRKKQRHNQLNFIIRGKIVLGFETSEK